MSVSREHQTHPLIGRSRADAPAMAAVLASRNGIAITRAHFLRDVMAVAQALPEHAYVINVCADRYLFMVGFAAALVRGQVSLLPPSRVTGVVIAIAADYPDSYLLVDGHVGDGALPQFRISVAADAPSPVTLSSDSHPAVPQIDLRQLAAILFTSGSTGQATPNPKTWESLVLGAAGNAAALLPPSGPTVTVVATVPSQHMYGFETTVMLPLQGFCAVQCDQPLYPEDVRRVLAVTPEPRLLITTPVHMRALAGFSGVMPALSGILCATAPFTRKLATSCEARFGVTVMEAYGSTESGITATRRTALDEPWRLLEAFEIEAGMTGTIFRAKHLPAQVQLQDYIEQLDERHFRLIGRGSDLINIAGKRASLGDLNAKLLAIDGVRDGIVFMPAASPGGDADGAIQRTAAFVVAPGMTRDQVLAALRQVVDPAFLPRPLIMVDALPRSESTKLPRAAVLKLFAEHIGDQGT
jgi:acyl-coenzyme A synthetase/AMP-(fatty) acid ligase